MKTKSLFVPMLALLAGVANPHDKNKSDYPEITLGTLAGAKVQLCKGFAEATTEYYLEHKMPKEFAAYQRTTEFESDKKAALLDLALRRMRAESAAAFDPHLTYQVRDRTAYLSEFQRSPDGFRVRLPGTSTFHAGTYTPPHGLPRTVNSPELYGLKNLLDDIGIRSSIGPSLYGYTVMSLDHEGNPVPRMKDGVRENFVAYRYGTPLVQLAYGFMPEDSKALQEQTAERTTIFVPVPEAQARAIAEIYRSQQERHAVADYFVRIAKCVQDPPGSNWLVARLVGLQLYAAKLEKKFFAAEPDWKRKALIAEWQVGE